MEAYHGLNAPFSFIGMGRSNNFIGEFSIALYSAGKRSLRTWTPVIPKSVLFVIAEMNDNADYWTLELLLNPTAKVPLVLIADGIFLLALGLVIIVFHLYEKVSKPTICAYLGFYVHRQKMKEKNSRLQRSIIFERLSRSHFSN